MSIILIVWVAGAYLFYEYRHDWLNFLSRLTVSLPERGEEKPHQAYAYLQRANEIVAEDGVDLRLMQKTCGTGFLPLKYRGEIEDFRPHWLDRLENWHPRNVPDTRTIEPDEYWKQHRPAVVDALKATLNAMELAYEIPAGVRKAQDDAAEEDISSTAGDESKIRVADEVALLARSICRDEIGVLAYGDYAEFLEVRAWRRVLKRRCGDGCEERDFGLPEKRRLTLEALRNSADRENYMLALRHYYSSFPPDPYDLPRSCLSRRYRLSCAAPREALDVFAKMIAVASDAGTLHRAHLASGYLQVQLLLDASSGNDPQHYSAAVNHFQIATGHVATASDAHLELARLYLDRARRAESVHAGTEDSGQRSRSPEALEYYELAFEQVQQLSLMDRTTVLERGGNLLADREDEYREAARRTLIGLGRFKEADCFSQLRDVGYGAREHCENLRL